MDKDRWPEASLPLMPMFKTSRTMASASLASESAASVELLPSAQRHPPSSPVPDMDSSAVCSMVALNEDVHNVKDNLWDQLTMCGIILRCHWSHGCGDSAFLN